MVTNTLTETPMLSPLPTGTLNVGRKYHTRLTPADTRQTNAQTDTPGRMPMAHWASDTLTPVPTSGEVEMHTPHGVGGTLEPGKNASHPGLPFPLTSPRAADLLQ